MAFLIFSGNPYLLMEATGNNPGEKCILLSPNLPQDGKEKCLVFKYSIRGQHSGSLSIRTQDNDILWREVGRYSKLATIGLYIP